MSETYDLAIEQQKAGQVVLLDQTELFIEPLSNLTRDRAVAPGGGLLAEPSEICVGLIARRHWRLRQGVAQVDVEVELTLLGDTMGIAERFGDVGEELLHLRR